MKTIGVILRTAALACSVLGVNGYAWYNTYSANSVNVHESEYVSVPATASVSIYGSGTFDSSAWAEARVTTPSGYVNCYTWNWLPENYGSGYNLSSGNYLVEFTTHEFSGGNNSVGYSVQIDW